MTKLNIYANKKLDNNKDLATIVEYLTEEYDTGKKWIDGRTIYGKILNIGDYNFLTGKNIFYHDISNLDMILNVQINNVFKENNRGYLWWGAYDSVTYDATEINIQTNSYSNFKKMNIILEYIKTI